MTRLPRLIAGALALITAGADAAGPKVVELFTSQGCNSCPPADALLGELARDPDVLALAFHVTYWNYLGWKDEFSQPQFDQRQRRYAQVVGRSSVYTPQMIVNGMRDALGSQRSAVHSALEKSAAPAAIALRLNGDVIELTLPQLEQRGDSELTLFGVRAGASTPVHRGENKGHTLQEFRIVRAVQSLGRWNGEARVLQVKRAGMPSDVNAFAVLAQEKTSGRVIAAGQ